MKLKCQKLYLVLKTADSKFVINGNYTVSPSGKYDASGTLFEYHRLEGNSMDNTKFKRTDGVSEWMTSLGPLLEPIHLMVKLKKFVQLRRKIIFVFFKKVLSQQTNPGIKYEYLLPTILASSDEALDTDYYSSVEDNVPLMSKLKAANYPTNTSSPTSNIRKRRKFSWKVVGFTACSKSCGGGKIH